MFLYECVVHKNSKPIFGPFSTISVSVRCLAVTRDSHNNEKARNQTPLNSTM